MLKQRFTLFYVLLFVFFLLSLQSCGKDKKHQSTHKSIPTITLNNGIQIPILGFGTLELNDSMGVNSVAKAISLGYRLFDTATVYGNEEAVGKGIKQSGIDRSELFITTKLWVSDMGYESTKEAFERSCKKLGTDYIDLYLIHRPRGDVKGSWKAMEELYREGKIRAIGVSNFDSLQLAEIMKIAEVKPAVNQIEVNPFFQEHELHLVNQNFGIQVEAWSPFAQGRNGLFDNEILSEIGKKYQKTTAQVVLRWIIQRGIAVIPRTSDSEYMKENLDVFDFNLSEADMQQIATLDLKTSQFPEWN